VPDEADRSIVSSVDGRLRLQNVLIPVDHTPDPTAAIEFATRIAAVIGDGKVGITLLHVGAERDAPRPPVVDGDSWSVVRMCREGDPAVEIAAVAEHVEADLIAMSTAGRSGVFEALQGSTTERVLRRARCPLLAVPSRPIPTAS
jgi:Universal stress protein family